MEILLNDNVLSNINFEFENESELISIFSQVCDVIDSKKIAVFRVFFSDLDPSLNNLTFAYDFESIAPYLKDLLLFLKETGTVEFELFFYESNRKVVFTKRRDIVQCTIYDSFSLNYIANRNISLANLTDMIEKICNDFEKVLKKYFYEVLQLFKKEKYLI